VNKTFSALSISDVKRHYRSYSPDFKRSLVEASFRADASVAAIAMSNGINPNLLHNWRAQSLKGRGRWVGTAGMVPVVVSDPPSQETRLPEPHIPEARLPEAGLADRVLEGQVEIDLAHKTIRITGALNRELLLLAVECLR